MGSMADLVAAAMGGRSQRSFAADVGINVSSISRILSGQTNTVRQTTLERIAVCADKDSGITLEKLVAAQNERRRIVRRCDCGAQQPLLYGEGVAKEYYKDIYDRHPAFGFSDFDGYVVECMECCAITRHYNSREEAVGAWNRHDLYYAGCAFQEDADMNEESVWESE